MENILLIADSPSDLTTADIENKPIWIAPVRITYNGTEHLEYYEIDRREYWKLLEQLEEIPTTAQVTPSEWARMFAKASGEGYTHILIHTISATASGMFNSASVAARQYMEDNTNSIQIEVIDSRTYSFIYGRNILLAAERIAAGRPFAEICREMRELTARNRAILWVYTLMHMKKSGRISGMAAFVGEALGLRPTLLIKDGLIEPVDKVRGDKNIIPKAVQLVQQDIVNPSEQVIQILYSDVPQEEIDRAVELVRELIRPRDVVLHSIGCSVTTNAGPTSMAICYLAEPFAL